MARAISLPIVTAFGQRAESESMAEENMLLVNGCKIEV
jgi:hypothetical protein